MPERINGGQALVVLGESTLTAEPTGDDLEAETATQPLPPQRRG